MKNINLYFISLILLVGFIVFIFYGAILDHHYKGGTKFKNLQNIAVFFAKIPVNIKFVIKNRNISGDIISPINKEPIKEKKFFNKNVDISRSELILISRHDGDLGRSVVELRDLNTFEVLHSYAPDINIMYEKIDLNKESFKDLQKDLGVNRFYINHPAITNNGDLIVQSTSPLMKFNLDGKLLWINDEYLYHHSINFDLDENIYVPSFIYPYSEKIKKLFKKLRWETLENTYGKYMDDGITILDPNGKIIYLKSVTEILIENNLLHRLFSQQEFKQDPIHLNDIEPVLEDGPFFKKGDLFLSFRNLSMVILYRPETNKIIKIIDGAFFNQHDVDILDEKTISIYNNNVLFNNKNQRIVENNEIILFDFETNEFSKVHEKVFKELNINSSSNALADFLDDRSIIIEDTNNGRVLYIDNEGNLIWEFNNLDSKKMLYQIWWCRIIKEEKANKLRKLISKNK